MGDGMKKLWKDLALLAVGALLVSLGVNCFLVPSKISTGGISGVATVLLYLANIPLPVTTLLLNLALILLGWRILSLVSVLKSLFGVALLSLFLQWTGGIFVYREEAVLAAVFGGALVGLGVGIPLQRDVTTGGSDFAALMLHKVFPHISPSSFILILDTAVILFSGLAFQDVSAMLCSILSLYVSGQMVDLILVRGDFAKSVMVISQKSSEISARILEELQRGVTAIQSRGCYENVRGEMLFCVVREREVPKLIHIVQSVDSGAFTVISHVRQVHGLGFEKT